MEIIIYFFFMHFFNLLMVLKVKEFIITWHLFSKFEASKSIFESSKNVRI